MHYFPILTSFTRYLNTRIANLQQSVSMNNWLRRIEEHPLTRKLEVRHEDGVSWTPSRWINRDIVPLPPYRRQWGPWTFVGFWLVAGVNISGWVCGSSLISLGLNVPQAMAVLIVAYITIATLFVGTGMPVRHH